MTNLKEGQQIKILAVKWIQLKHMKTIKSHLEAALVCSRLWVPRHPCVCTTVWLKFRLSRSGGGHFSAAWLWLPQSPLKVLRHSMNEFHFQEVKFSKTSQYFQNCKLHQWAYLEGYNCLFFFYLPTLTACRREMNTCSVCLLTSVNSMLTWMTFRQLLAWSSTGTRCTL